MKKSIVWVVLLIMVVTVFNSCKKDDPAPIPAIVGTWTLSKYELTELKTGFTSYEGFETTFLLGIEAGYTFVFSNDGTYTRAYTVSGGYPSVNDKGKWTMDGTKLTLSPNDPDDLDLIEDYGTVGTKFTVEGDISDIRMVLTQVDLITLYLLPDSFPDGQTPTNADYKPVDIKVLYKFNKL